MSLKAEVTFSYANEQIVQEYSERIAMLFNNNQPASGGRHVQAFNLILHGSGGPRHPVFMCYSIADTHAFCFFCQTVAANGRRHSIEWQQPYRKPAVWRGDFYKWSAYKNSRGNDGWQRFHQ